MMIERCLRGPRKTPDSLSNIYGGKLTYRHDSNEWLNQPSSLNEIADSSVFMRLYLDCRSSLFNCFECIELFSNEGKIE